MPHPIEMVYKNTIKDVVCTFIKSLPEHIQRSRPTISHDEAEKLILDYEGLWNTCYAEIITAISREISYYINYYGISPQGSIDEFKAVYFTGRVVSRFLDRDGLSDIREINDYVTIALLDYKLEKDASHSRPIMTKALRKIASENEFEKKLGRHGMYLIYKSNCNIVNGK